MAAPPATRSLLHPGASEALQVSAVLLLVAFFREPGANWNADQPFRELTCGRFLARWAFKRWRERGLALERGLSSGNRQKNSVGALFGDARMGWSAMPAKIGMATEPVKR